MAASTWGKRQAWILNPLADCVFILAPAFISTLFALWTAHQWGKDFETPPWGWLIFVLGIDVAHVYATLFRTFWDPLQRKERPALLVWVPLTGWLIGVFFYSFGASVFWRVLAYLALFHFVRQQYGFLKLYNRQETQASWEKSIDAMGIYVSTLYPVIFWHLNYPRSFSWFVSNDFIDLTEFPMKDWVMKFLLALYVLVAVAYILKELISIKRNRFFNIPKNLIMLGTALSWYVGIVTLRGDFTFTITNVVSHGIPYMGLVWMLEHRKGTHDNRLKTWIFMNLGGVVAFLGILVALAFAEETLWDMFVWGDHPEFFKKLSGAFVVSDKATLTWLVPLLALPQSTHYLFDGFIWRIKKLDLKTRRM